MSSSAEDRREEQAKAMLHKTKVIQFLGRTAPIILQNDNGPCPLLAICNVLSLKNSLNLSPDGGDVSQEKLLSLVAERLIDSNSNVDDKDAGYIENQQQNIADAIDLLPRLTTGIDVNIKFTGIRHFEFTRECAIFDLLDIPLYHGWIVDPQDHDTAKAIGSKSYNTLMGELVALETRNVGSEYNKEKSSEDCIDFAAATTATLGVPSPCLSRGKSFDDSPHSVSDNLKARKGDFEEEAELLRALKLSEAEILTSVEDVLGDNSNGHNLSVNSNESVHLKKSETLVLVETLEGKIDEEIQRSHQQESSVSDGSKNVSNYNNDLITSVTVPEEDVWSYLKKDKGNPSGQSNSEEFGELVCKDVVEKTIVNALVKSETALFNSSGPDPTSACENHMHNNGGDELVQQQSTLRGDKNEAEDKQTSGDTVDFSCSSVPNTELDSSGGRRNNIDVPETVTSSAEGSEPIYEGEECVLDSGTKTCEDQEPMYEGEVVLAEQVGKDSKDAFDISSQDEITPKEGEVIRNFLKNSASQLTVYGLFCLQEGLKDNELCVFFRNNHFNTMFKFKDELYLLATDQGYINQPDLVWEKLNEVNGNTVFMTGKFEEFKIDENHANTAWDEQIAMGDTSDYLPKIDGSDSTLESDEKLARELQQREYEQQPQRNLQQPTASSSSRLVTGPQVSRNSGRNSSSSSKQEAKSSKDKCVLM